MFIALGVLATIAAVGCYLTERVDRPRRRAMRLADATPAE
jgi:hypothetical protein